MGSHFLIFDDISFSFISGSYDRTCKVWDTDSGEELYTLEGHRNVVYAIAFNNPYGSVLPEWSITVCSSLICGYLIFYAHSDKIVTGSFDKTCKVRTIDVMI